MRRVLAGSPGSTEISKIGGRRYLAPRVQLPPSTLQGTLVCFPPPPFVYKQQTIPTAQQRKHQPEATTTSSNR